MKRKSSVLLISYVFPPYPGVGGRRWAKFAKYLVRNDLDVYVISATNPFDHQSLFMDDVKDKRIKVSYIGTSYPKVHIVGVRSFMDKIRYRLSLLKMKLSEKGNYFDRGIFTKKELIALSSEMITKHNIENVIVTGAPFSILHHAIHLKSGFPSLNMIADIRDPWTWGSGYGMFSLSDDRKKIEREREKNVLKNYDHVLVPSDEMASHLKRTYHQYEHKVEVIPHGFDPDEIKKAEKTPSKALRLVFYGTIYKEIENSFRKLSQLLHKEKDIVLDIYSQDQRFSNYFKQEGVFGTQVNYRLPLVPEKLFSQFGNYDFALVLQPDFAKDFITTKIYEIIYSNTPIILIAPKGALSEFIEKYRLGIFIDSDEDLSVLKERLRTAGSFDLHRFPINDYNYEKLTEKVISYLK